MGRGNKRGRPAKPGERYACGKLKPTGDPIAPVAWQRIRSDVAKLLKDDRLSSEVGRLSFHKELTDEQVTAAFRVAAIYGAFERHKGKSRSARSPSYEQGFGGTSGVAEELLTKEAMADLKARIRASEESFKALQDEINVYPRQARAALEALCVEDRAIRADELEVVRIMLRRLAGFFGTGAARKRERGRPKPVKVTINPTAIAPPSMARADVDRAVWLKAAKILRPDLSEADLLKAHAGVEVLRAREIFNRTKGTPGAKSKVT